MQILDASFQFKTFHFGLCTVRPRSRLLYTVVVDFVTFRNLVVPQPFVFDFVVYFQQLDTVLQ